MNVKWCLFAVRVGVRSAIGWGVVLGPHASSTKLDYSGESLAYDGHGSSVAIVPVAAIVPIFACCRSRSSHIVAVGVSRVFQTPPFKVAVHDFPVKKLPARRVSSPWER